jgi:hypothetical protein
MRERPQDQGHHAK